MAISRALGVQSEPDVFNRWLHSIAGVFAMPAIANKQYPWKLFATPLTVWLHASFAAILAAFAGLISRQNWLVPIEDCLNCFNPCRVIAIDGAPGALRESFMRSCAAGLSVSLRSSRSIRSHHCVAKTTPTYCLEMCEPMG
jgi:hypothetical protein